MRQFKNILYASHSTSDETAGLKQALSLARNSGAALRVLVVCPALPSQLEQFRAKYESALLNQAHDSVERTTRELALPEDAVELSVELATDEKPAVRIVQEVLRNRHDLLIKEADLPGRGEGFWAIDMSLLRKCPCPVWLSRPIDRHRQDIRVAVAVDPQVRDADGRALAVSLIRTARSLADNCSGKLDVVACTDYPHESFLRNNPWAQAAAPEVAEAIARGIAESRAALDDLIAEADAGDHTVHHIHGEAQRAVPTFVEDADVDVLVMGTMARRGLRGLLLGNTAENIAQALSCSLIAVKPVDYVSPIKL